MPDGSCDLTAHVAVDSLEHDELDHPAGGAARAGAARRAPPTTTSPRTDPAGYLAALAGASAVGALTAPDGLGGFAWVLRRVPRM